MIPIKQNWKIHARLVERFHLSSILLNRHWTIRQTAESLNRSNGGISEDLRLSMGLRVIPMLDNFLNRYEALEYLRFVHKCENYDCRNWTQEQIKNILDSLFDELNDV